MSSFRRREDGRWVDEVPGSLAWSTRIITRDAPAAECPECRALVILDGAAMTEHRDWHGRIGR